MRFVQPGQLYGNRSGASVGQFMFLGCVFALAMSQVRGLVHAFGENIFPRK